jgi:hypothetical protein
MKSTALMAYSMIMGWWDMIPHGQVNMCKHFTGTCCPHIQGRQNCSPPYSLYLCSYLHGVTSPPYKRHGNNLTVQYKLNTQSKQKNNLWIWGRMEKISWINHVSNEETHYLRVNEQRNILHEIRRRKANWIGHILHRNGLLRQVIEGKIKERIEVTGRHRKLLDDLKERRGYSHLKEEALDLTPCSGRDFEPVMRQTTT